MFLRPMRAIVAALASTISPSMVSAVEHMNVVAQTRHRIDFDRVGPKRVRTGRAYPHSSTRQRARYARQIAAGQLNIARVGE